MFGSFGGGGVSYDMFGNPTSNTQFTGVGSYPGDPLAAIGGSTPIAAAPTYNAPVATANAPDLPTDHTAIGSAVASLSPQEQTDRGLAEYYTDPNNFATLSAYLQGTYFDKGTYNVGGTNWTDASSFGREIFGTPWANEWDYSKLTPESITKAFGTNAGQILGDARDWEMRDVSRQNQQGSFAKTLAGIAGPAIGALTGNPLIGAGAGGLFGGASGGPAAGILGAIGGYGAGGGFDSLTAGIKESLGLGGNEAFVNAGGLGLSGTDLFNPTSLATNAVPNAGLGINAANLFNPAALGGAINSGVTALNGGAYTPGGGFLNPNGIGDLSSELYDPVSLGGVPTGSNGLLDAAKEIGGDFISDAAGALFGSTDATDQLATNFGGGAGDSTALLSALTGDGGGGTGLSSAMETFFTPLASSGSSGGNSRYSVYRHQLPQFFD